MKKGILDNKYMYLIFVLALILLSLILIIFVKDYIGYTAYPVEAKAGNVTGIVIHGVSKENHWHGIFGLVFSEEGYGETQSEEFSAGEVSSQIFVFDCVDPTLHDQEFYASTNETVSFENVIAGTVDMIDYDYLSLTSGYSDRANVTFNYTVNISLGATLIENVPAAYTYVNDAPDPDYTFYTGILNASGTLLLVTRLLTESTTSFKNTDVKFQMLLPIANESERYYFFADPNDDCPGGYSTGQTGDAFIAGYVYESNTTTPIPNATVSIAGNSTLTDSNGFFNFTVQGGYRYNIVTIKESYIPNVTNVNTTIGSVTNINISLTKFHGYTNSNSTVYGYVKDNASGLPIANITVSAGGVSVVSNQTGNYSLSVPYGTHLIVAVGEGYESFIGNFTIEQYKNLSYIINMTKIPENFLLVNGTVVQNATITGTVRDNSSQEILPNVTISIAGRTNYTDSQGIYNFTLYEGTKNIIATKVSYEPYYSEVNITRNVITVHDINLTPIIVEPDVPNGSIEGYVFSDDGNLLSGATVSAAGKTYITNETGFYNLEDIIPGTHWIVSFATGYNNYITTLNVTSNNITYHNITLETYIEAGLGEGEGAGQGAGQGPGEGEGKGPGTGIIAKVEEPIEMKDYEVSVTKIIKKILEGTYINEKITILNFRENSVSIDFSIEGKVKELIRLDIEDAVLDGLGGTELTMTILGNVDPGVYEGYFVVSGDIDDKIPIYILVTEKDRLDVETLYMRVTPEKRKGIIGGLFKYSVDLQNFLSIDEYDVDLKYYLEGINMDYRKLIDEDNIRIFTSYTIIKSARLPYDLEEGDYRIVVEADYLDRSSEAATIFAVRLPFYKYAVFGLIPLWLLFLIVVLLSTTTYGVIIVKKKRADKQRYQIELDYSQLPKPGPRSAYVGLIAETKTKTYLDLDQFQVHTLVAGSTGGGKTVAAQGIIEEALLKNTAVIVFDPTVQWTGFLRKCQDKRFLDLYSKFGYKKTDARAFNGNIKQINDPREVLNIKKVMKPGEINVFVANKLDVRDYEIFVSNVIREVFHENLPEAKQLKLMIIFDEFHRLLPKYGGTGEVLIQVERATREFRKWGVGLLLISQVISDFKAEVLANINTQIQMRTKDEGDLNRIKEEYGENLLKSLVKASVGAGMVENSAYNKGKPYFIQFRPLLHSTVRLSDKELESYNKYNTIIDDIDFQLEELEKKDIDVFDLRLELKLAQDKVKSGSFNMVDIYIDGLKPRVMEQYKKLGIKPKKREINLASEEELAKELAKAKKEREQSVNQLTPAQNETKNQREKKEEIEGNNESEKKEEKDSVAADNSIGSKIEVINSKLENASKEFLISSYKNLQTLYKEASKEQKVRIFRICKTIQKKLK